MICFLRKPFRGKAFTNIICLGSKINGGTGSGLCYMKFEEVTYRDNKELNPTSTVYEAELIAIQMACKLMFHDSVFKKYVPKELTILSDSLSAIKALHKVEITGDTALETITLMNELGKKNQTGHQMD